MKASILFATGLILATGIVIGAMDAAHAGAGGSAGSISAQFTATGNDLTATAGAVAVGKTGAVTSATTTPTGITAAAAGYSGGIVVTKFNDTDISYDAGLDNSVGTAQANNFNSTAKSGLNLVPATVGVSLK